MLSANLRKAIFNGNLSVYERMFLLSLIHRGPDKGTTNEYSISAENFQWLMGRVANNTLRKISKSLQKRGAISLKERALCIHPNTYVIEDLSKWEHTLVDKEEK